MGVIRGATLSALGLLVMAVSTADAQYFGRNKVEYTNFDFRILSTQHFDVYHYRREEAAARVAARLAERWYARFSRVLRHELDSRQPLVLYGSQPEFTQTNVVSSLMGDTVGGVTESAKRRIAMAFAPTLAETDHVLGHEIAHAFQFDIAKRHGGSWGLPPWFVEGMAEYLARGREDADSSLWLRDMVASERLPNTHREAARTLSPYQYGHALWAYLAERFGDPVIEKALKPAKRGKINDRIPLATGVDLERLYSDWRAAIQSRYRQEQDTGASAFAAAFRHDASGRVQLGPSLSPDGRLAVFFSERDRFSLDLFLADVATGRIVRKLATTTASARFDSLQPLRTAGAWSQDGAWFAFPAVRQGHATVVLFDMRNPGHDREVSFAGLAQILSATWSPTGRLLAFSALDGGFSNLYLYDLDRAALRQMTDDPYADLHPAWSPDGTKIAFATDRYSSDLPALRFNHLGFATLDPESGAVRALPVGPASATQTNPQWAVGGRDLYFVDDPDGVRDVFRLDLESRVTHRVTDVGTGVTGLTGTSPALAVAARAPVLAFTLYTNRRHECSTRAVTGATGTIPDCSRAFSDRTISSAVTDGIRASASPTPAGPAAPSCSATGWSSATWSCVSPSGACSRGGSSTDRCRSTPSSSRTAASSGRSAAEAHPECCGRRPSAASAWAFA
jgi:Tol biopolymer transport system component